MSALLDSVIRDWATARSVARGLPVPVADHGGWRVDTRSPGEECRYFFAAPVPGLAALAATIDRPRVFIKLCDTREVLARLVPAGWVFEVDTWVMEGAPIARGGLAPGYRVDRTQEGERVEVRIVADDGTFAASGYGGRASGVFAYDRIVTDDRHRRLGLGRAVMALLGEAASPGDRHVLVATAMGRALYESIGWCVRSDYTTAFIPEPG
ncbi:GNAT family N-acetyltransferase [Sphingomonas oligophenolica]|uniref:GNAT family N-acetyltransferase n=1 Tax=Sphingomonas oligophenolica TaxID=301154 RepID=UPI001F4F8A8F|nr:GNAT family N-acetyltransferase [Sphingomonas oligophenolica]